jgi:dolichyl-phosphate beta-glucosyltransferase
MYGFHLLVLTCVQGIKDTQCGFKLFTRKTAHTLFPSLHINRWAFDVELLYLARVLGVPVVEASVNWTEVEGSKLDPLTSSIQMARDILRIRLCYTVGLWRLYQEEVALSDVSGLSIEELEKKKSD